MEYLQPILPLLNLKYTKMIYKCTRTNQVNRLRIIVAKKINS